MNLIVPGTAAPSSAENAVGCRTTAKRDEGDRFAPPMHLVKVEDGSRALETVARKLELAHCVDCSTSRTHHKWAAQTVLDKELDARPGGHLAQPKGR